MEDELEFTRTAHEEEGLKILKKDILALVESGTSLGILARESCVTEDELTSFIYPERKKSGARGIASSKPALNRVRDHTSRMIREGK